jgi:hypothetical protein
MFATAYGWSSADLEDLTHADLRYLAKLIGRRGRHG